LYPLSTDTAHTRRRSGSAVKTFSEWIENEPKEKRVLLYDTDGARYGIMTTNFVEIYNCVLRGVRGLHWLQLWNSSSADVPIILGIGSLKIRHTCKNPNIYFRRIMTEYMTKKPASAQLHHVRQCGTQELKFEVARKDRARRGMRLTWHLYI
jgi:hypothetical protein